MSSWKKDPCECDMDFSRSELTWFEKRFIALGSHHLVVSTDDWIRPRLWFVVPQWLDAPSDVISYRDLSCWCTILILRYYGKNIKRSVLIWNNKCIWSIQKSVKFGTDFFFIPFSSQNSLDNGMLKNPTKKISDTCDSQFVELSVTAHCNI